MSILDVTSFAAGNWIGSSKETARDIKSAVTGEVIAQAGNGDLDYQAMLDYARNVGGPALRSLTFHDRARILKSLATYLNAKRDILDELS